MNGEEPAAEKSGCGLGVDFEEHFAARLDRKAQALGVDPVAAEHAPDRNRAERLKQLFQAVGVHETRQAGALRASGFAGVIATLSPQPQAEVSLGLEKAKLADRRSTLKSICEPSRNSTALGSA